VSSERNAFSLSKIGLPSSNVVVQGLQCLVHLAHTFWEVMGPVKTAQVFLLQDDRTIELDALMALSLLKKNDTPLEDGSNDNGSAAEFCMTKSEVKNIYNHDVSHAVILKYLEALREIWGHYIDSASGEKRRVDGQAVFLLLLRSTCFHDICDSDGAKTQEDLICPISLYIMQNPVKCSDGHTYNRNYIEKWAQENEASPKTKEIFKFDEQEQFGSAETFLEKFLAETRLACLTGPPASGKTVTMQQLVRKHAATSLEHIKMQKDIPLLPVFMRAAELSRLLSDVGKVGLENVAEMRHLVKVFLDKGDFFLDEDARQRIPEDLVERIIDGAVKQKRN
jgi:hypothetical protein